MMYQLVADIGGTNARFALCQKETNELSQVHTMQCENFGSPLQAINHFLSQVDTQVDEVCLAVACPVEGDTVKLTNNHWQFSKEQLAHSLGVKKLIAINDFTAAAMATTVIEDDDLFFLSDNKCFDNGKQRCIVGPGTGLGVAGVVPYYGKSVILTTEGGHRSFSPENEVEDYILNFLRMELTVVSCEELLSGRGLVNIYRAICSYHQQSPTFSDAESIGCAALDGNEMAKKSLEQFFETLGSIAGDYALALGATGGVFIGGGIAPRFASWLNAETFRQRFENKLNYQKYLKKIPTAIVMHEQPGLLGAAAYLYNS